MLIFLMASVVAGAFFLPGFLPNHGGSGGPHLFAVARNMLQTPGFIGADLVYTNATFHPYNHHPPLYFWLQAAVTSQADTFASRLQLAYLLASALTALGLGVLYHALRRLAFSPANALFGVAAAIGTYTFVNYRNIVNFDSASLLLAALLFLTIAAYHRHPSRRTLWHVRLTCLLALMVSWYAVTFIFAYLATLLVLKFRTSGLRATLASPAMVSALLTGSFAILLFTLLCINEYLATGAIQTLQTAFGRNLGINPTLTTYNPPATHIAYMLVRRVAETLPLHLIPLAMAFALPSLRHPLVASIRNQLPTPGLLPAAATLTAGATLFILATAKWSSVHPFAYIWLLPVVALATAMVTQAATSNPRLYRATAVLTMAGAFGWLTLATVRDATHTRATTTLLQLADTLPAPAAFSMPEEFSCGPFADGAFRYLTSTPHKRLPMGQTIAPAPYTTVVAQCTNPTTGSLRFTLPATGQVFLVNYGSASIQQETSQEEEPHGQP